MADTNTNIASLINPDTLNTIKNSQGISTFGDQLTNQSQQTLVSGDAATLTNLLQNKEALIQEEIDLDRKHQQTLLQLQGINQTNDLTGGFTLNRITDEDLKKYYKLIIENLEGGYYNPAWKLKGMGISGETMYGQDRAHDEEFIKTPWGIMFWHSIDSDKKDHPQCYVNEYMPHKGTGYFTSPTKITYNPSCYNPELGRRLISWASLYSIKIYKQWCKSYLSEESNNIVNNTPRLAINFAYAVFNGIVLFKSFSNKINSEVKKGNKDPNSLAKIMIEYRRHYPVDWNNENAANFMTRVQL